VREPDSTAKHPKITFSTNEFQKFENETKKSNNGGRVLEGERRAGLMVLEG
jgi:hypothetical protein